MERSDLGLRDPIKYVLSVRLLRGGTMLVIPRGAGMADGRGELSVFRLEQAKFFEPR